MLLSTVNAFNLSCQPNRTKKNKSKVIHAGEHCWFKEGECANPLIKTNEMVFFQMLTVIQEFRLLCQGAIKSSGRSALGFIKSCYTKARNEPS